MPYLTFSKAYIGKENYVQTPNILVDAYGEEKIHELRTLDRYYYTSLSETDVRVRNKDQVLTKYIKTKKDNSISRKEVKSAVRPAELEVQPVQAPLQSAAAQPAVQPVQPALPAAAQPAHPAAQATAKQSEKPGEDEKGLILQVDQLWLWVIDGGKIEFYWIKNILEALTMFSRQNNH